MAGLWLRGIPIFSQSADTIKIYFSGVVFKGYIGMDPYGVGTPGSGGHGLGLWIPEMD